MEVQKRSFRPEVRTELRSIHDVPGAKLRAPPRPEDLDRRSEAPTAQPYRTELPTEFYKFEIIFKFIAHSKKWFSLKKMKFY